MAMSTVTIFGYGSLLSYQSVLSTMPSATNFRGATLNGYSRNFNLVSINGIRSGTADLLTMEMAALTIRKDASGFVKGCFFDIPDVELVPYLEREHRYIPIQVEAIDEKSNQNVLSWTVIEQTNDEYKNSMSADEWQVRIGQYYKGILYGRTDILPMRSYLNNCLLFSYHLGGVLWLKNMLECKLADGSSIKQYVTTHFDRFNSDVQHVITNADEGEL
jgi:cation transport regulator ChaC